MDWLRRLTRWLFRKVAAEESRALDYLYEPETVAVFKRTTVVLWISMAHEEGSSGE